VSEQVTEVVRRALARAHSLVPDHPDRTATVIDDQPRAHVVRRAPADRLAVALPLTPLTGRAVGAWLIGLGIAVAQGVWDGDVVRLGVLWPGPSTTMHSSASAGKWAPTPACMNAVGSAGRSDSAVRPPSCLFQQLHGRGFSSSRWFQARSCSTNAKHGEQCLEWA
jgi:hypothetical protein